mmetsp:Transcript_13914/g.30563  ORF Transcript_13914/g.30563 Transcript_13914/m.30563 type:complete len:340 (-) Transcript_13914:76-1095(-)
MGFSKKQKIDDDDASSSDQLPKVPDAVTQPLLCPITQELMVDPVLAEDGHMYERRSIEEWISRNPVSPIFPNKRLNVNSLVAVRGMQESIQALVEAGAVDDKLSDSWTESKKDLDLTKAKKLFKEGSVMDVAKLGFPKAQGVVAEWYFNGRNGMEKDTLKCEEWARKAAEGGDGNGQFRMGYFCSKGIPGIISEDKPTAISWYEKASKQGYSAALFNIAQIYEHGGCQFHHSFLQKSAYWYRKAANKSLTRGMIKIGKLHYQGKGAKKSLKVAREWFQKAVDKKKKKSSEARFLLGKMMMKGEGGPKDILRGFKLIERSASEGLPCAEKCITDVIKVLD